MFAMVNLWDLQISLCDSLCELLDAQPIVSLWDLADVTAFYSSTLSLWRIPGLSSSPMATPHSLHEDSPSSNPSVPAPWAQNWWPDPQTRSSTQGTWCHSMMESEQREQYNSLTSNIAVCTIFASFGKLNPAPWPLLFFATMVGQSSKCKYCWTNCKLLYSAILIIWSQKLWSYQKETLLKEKMGSGGFLFREKG